MLSRAIRVSHDTALLSWQKEQILSMLLDDEVCYQADINSQREVERKLAEE